MAIHNVLIKCRTASMNIDSLNRTAVCEEDIDNGCVFALKSYSETEGEGMVWKAEKATANEKGLWIATSPEVINTRVFDGDVDSKVAPLDYRGIVNDPRAFTNHAGSMIDATYLSVGDIYEMTCSGTDFDPDGSSHTHLVPDYGTSFKLKGAASAGTGTALRMIGKSYLHIGNAALVKIPVPTYKFVVEAN